jgi:dienelactone hydrolase
MTLRDYLYATAPDAYFTAANAYIQKWDERSYRGMAKGDSISVDAVLGLRGTACTGAEVVVGKHPVVVYSGGWYNRSPDNVALAEYLASYGYVVVEVPLFGSGLWTGDLRSTPAALETQARDLEVAIGAVGQYDWVDRGRLAVAGYSSGGIVAILVGARNPLVRGIIGLDPSYMGEPEKVLGSPLFSVERFKTPMLTLRSGNALYTSRPRDALIDTLQWVERFTADVGKGSHGDFSDDAVIETTLSLVRRGQPRTAREGITAYRAAVKAVHQFLDGVLLGKTGALDSLAAPTDATLRMKHAAAAPPRK